MVARCSSRQPVSSYFVVMIDYGRRGREAIVDPELTRTSIVDRIKSREYDRIAFIHEVVFDPAEDCGHVIDLTNALLAEAGFYADSERELA